MSEISKVASFNNGTAANFKTTAPAGKRQAVNQQSDSYQKILFDPEYEKSRTYQDACRVQQQVNNVAKGNTKKSGIELALSVATCAAGVYALGKSAGAITSALFKTAPNKLETVLKKGSEAVKTKAETLSANTTPGKLGNFKTFAGKALSTVEDTSRGIYKKIAYKGIPQDATAAEKVNKAFNNVVGAGFVAGFVPAICKRDADGDGHADITQKGVNAYTGIKNTVDEYNALSNIINTLT